MKVKSISKIPFSKKEFESAFINKLNNSITEVASILKKNSCFLFKNEENLVCGFDGDEYFLFRKNRPEIDNGIDIKNTHENIEDLRLKAPETKHLNDIFTVYKKENNSQQSSQKRKYNFVAGIHGESIYELTNGNWVVTDWTENKLAYPVWVYELDGITDERCLLITLVKRDLEPDVNFSDLQMESFRFIKKVGKAISVDDGKIYVEFKSIPKDIIDEVEEYICETLLQARGINNPKNMKEISNFLLTSEKRRCAHLERYTDSFIDGTEDRKSVV